MPQSYVFITIILSLISSAHAQIPAEIPLWSHGAPRAQGSDPVDTPTLRVYLPDLDKANGTAMVVCPGGGYHIVAIDHEGAQAARMLNRAGITAFVLRYRLQPKYLPADSLVDAQRAIRWVRHHAVEYKLDSHRVGIMGFSAGGHLTSAVGTHNDNGDSLALDPIDQQSCRPDFMAVCYPVISKELYSGGYDSTNLVVTEQTPPTFLFHTTEDTGVVPENSVRFYQALVAKKVPAELHIFASGPHGVGLAPGDPAAGQWPTLLTTWLRAGNWLTSAKRVPVSGKITLDGRPLQWAWITFVPVSNDTQPVAFAFLAGQADGSYNLDTTHGPTPGKHRIEIRQVGTILGPAPTLNDTIVLVGPGSKINAEVDIKEGEKTTLNFTIDHNEHDGSIKID
jgi:acetyl esterase/lipase